MSYLTHFFTNLYKTSITKVVLVYFFSTEKEIIFTRNMLPYLFCLTVTLRTIYFRIIIQKGKHFNFQSIIFRASYSNSKKKKIRKMYFLFFICMPHLYSNIPYNIYYASKDYEILRFVRNTSGINIVL